MVERIPVDGLPRPLVHAGREVRPCRVSVLTLGEIGVVDEVRDPPVVVKQPESADAVERHALRAEVALRGAGRTPGIGQQLREPVELLRVVPVPSIDQVVAHSGQRPVCVGVEEVVGEIGHPRGASLVVREAVPKANSRRRLCGRVGPGQQRPRVGGFAARRFDVIDPADHFGRSRPHLAVGPAATGTRQRVGHLVVEADELHGARFRPAGAGRVRRLRAHGPAHVDRVRVKHVTEIAARREVLLGCLPQRGRCTAAIVGPVGVVGIHVRVVLRGVAGIAEAEAVGEAGRAAYVRPPLAIQVVVDDLRVGPVHRNR